MCTRTYLILWPALLVVAALVPLTALAGCTVQPARPESTPQGETQSDATTSPPADSAAGETKTGAKDASPTPDSGSGGTGKGKPPAPKTKSTPAPEGKPVETTQVDLDCDETKPTQFIASGFVFQDEVETFFKVDEAGDPLGSTCGILGRYQRFPVENGWHTGVISYVESEISEHLNHQYLWTNEAGNSWRLYPEFNDSRFNTDSENPYYDYPAGESHPHFTIFAGHPDVSEGENRKRPIDFFTTIEEGATPIGAVGEIYELEGWVIQYGCCTADEDVTAKVYWGDENKSVEVPIVLYSKGGEGSILASHIYSSEGNYNARVMVFTRGRLIAEDTFNVSIAPAPATTVISEPVPTPAPTVVPSPTLTPLPDLSSSSGRIAFVSDRDGNWEIYVMEADGSNQTRLTSNSAWDAQPSWSPDGSKVAFQSTRDGNWAIYVMDADGSNQINLTGKGSYAEFPSWSPDGSKVVFDTRRDGNQEVYVMAADGSNQINLTNNDAGDAQPSWSRDGSKIAFKSDRDGNSEIYVMDSDGSNQTRLTSNDSYAESPSWSSDGSKIAFGSIRDGNLAIYVMDADGSNQINLTSNDSSAEFPSWSPDGSKIGFHSYRDGNEEVYVMDADGSNQTRLTSNSVEDRYPDWGPAR